MQRDFLPPNPWLESGQNRTLRYRAKKFFRQALRGVWEFGVWAVKLQTIAVAAIIFAIVTAGIVKTVLMRAEPPPDVVTAIRQIHGFGINPKDGVLYAATDLGLFRIEATDRASRVASSRQNPLGFAVIGPDTFLTSGQADLLDVLSDREPRLRGFVKSVDGGRSWKPISLAGEANLTSIQIRHGAIYGYDLISGYFIVSVDDGKSWEQRAMPGQPMADIAISPRDPNRILATTEEAVALESRDGGRSWQSLTEMPIQLLDWTDEQRLWAAGPETLYSSSDDGTTWEQRGAIPGKPAAFLAHEGVLYLATRGSDIYVSQDDGLTWQMFYRNPA